MAGNCSYPDAVDSLESIFRLRVFWEGTAGDYLQQGLRF